MTENPARLRRTIDRHRWEAVRARLGRSLSARFYLRVHMTLILAVAWLGGVGAAWAMKRMGLEDLAWRYSLAVLAAYLVFVLGMVLWVHYLRGRRSGSDADPSDLADAVPSDRGGGADADAPSGGGSGSLLDLAVLDGEGLVVVGVAVLAIIVAIGGGIYLIWEAPTLAVEGVLELVLATGMLRVRGVESVGVTRFVLERTWWIAALAVVSALTIAYLRSWAT